MAMIITHIAASITAISPVYIFALKLLLSIATPSNTSTTSATTTTSTTTFTTGSAASAVDPIPAPAKA